MQANVSAPKKKGFKLDKAELKDIGFRLFIVLISSALYALSVAWFLDPAGLLSLGLTGVGQIFNRMFILITDGKVNIPVGVFTFVCNLPLCLIGFRYVSPKFVIYTLCSVLIMSIFLMGWIPCPVSMNGGITWVPTSELVNGVYMLDGNAYYIFGINPETEKLFLSIIAGILCGIGLGIALRYGVSTGGVDIIAQAVNLKDSKFSVGTASMVFNIIIAFLGGIQIGMINISFYTIIFIIICNIVLDKIHTAYTFQRLDIITTKPDEVTKALLETVNRGITLSKVEGGFTHTEKFDCIMVVSSYEVDKAKNAIFSVDKDAWVTVSPIKKIFGAFFKHTII